MPIPQVFPAKRVVSPKMVLNPRNAKNALFLLTVFFEKPV
jgi:hypothetical protein